MKSLISRESHRPEKRYSGVYHIQGGMVTDADLDERSRITQDRTDNLGDDTIKDGVPEEDGVVTIADDGSLSLQEGDVYADGVRGVVVLRDGETIDSSFDLFDKQADFPLAPGIISGTEQLIYADIWDRPVHPLEDAYLADAGLHGAVTAFRTRTMAQLKSAPLSEELADQLKAETGHFRRLGTAKLAVTPLNAEILADDCDPCADEVSAEQQIANALWRLEVIDVTGTPENPQQVTLAWSIENAAAIAPAGVEEDAFERTKKVYEFYSEITDSHLGVFHEPSDAKRSAFVDDLSTTPSPATDHNGDDWPWVRRWDGHAVVDVANNTLVGELGSGFKISVSGSTVTLQVDAFECELDFTGSAAVAGDYWLVELRRFADQPDRVRLVSETPYGVVHHYCALFRIDGNGDVLELTDAETRRLSFPALSDLPATHVGFDNNCDDLYADAENVQEALDKLCNISAEHIDFTVKCSDLYDDAKNVQEALDALCNIDFSVRETFRHLFDWGVVCGIVPRLIKRGEGQISISPGSYLDRSGQLTDFAGGNFDLSELKLGETILFDSDDALQTALARSGACLALAAGPGGDTKIFVVPEAIAYGPDDPGFLESVRNCLNKKQVIDLKANVGKLSAGRKAVANRVILTASSDSAFSGSGKLTPAEADNARAFNSGLSDAFAKVATEEEVAFLKMRTDQAIKDNPVGNLQGSAREVREMQQATAIFTAFARTDEERMRRCVCEALFPTCPPPLGKELYFVPIACLKGKFSEPRFSLEEVCAFCCRKQAMTWRSLQYFIGENRERMAKQMAAVCCGDPVSDNRFDPGLKYDPGKYTNIEYQRIMQDYRVAEAFVGETRKSPTDYQLEVQVNDLNEEEARSTLIGSGLVVVDTIDVDDDKAYDRIVEKSVGVDSTDQFIAGRNVKPGDKVGLLLQDGVARGYVLLERGSGKPLFERPKTKISVDITDEDEIKAVRLKEATDTAKEELTGLVGIRETLTAEVDKLKTDVEDIPIADLRTQTDTIKSELSDLKNQRETLTGEIKQLGDEVGRLSSQRDGMLGEMRKIGEELAAADSNRKVFMRSVREQQPVIALLGTKGAALANSLAGEKILTVADLLALKSTRIKALERADILKEAETRRLMQQAAEFTKID